MPKTIEPQEFHTKLAGKLNALLVPVDQEFIGTHPAIDNTLLHPLNDSLALRYPDLVQYIMAQEAAAATAEPATMQSVSENNPIACIACQFGILKGPVTLDEETPPLSFEHCLSNIEDAVLEDENKDSKPSIRAKGEGRGLVRLLCSAGINPTVANQTARDIIGYALETKNELLGIHK